MCAAVQGLLWLCAEADMVAVHAASVLQHRGAEAHRVEIVGNWHRLPSICRLVVGRETYHVRL